MPRVLRQYPKEVVRLLSGGVPGSRCAALIGGTVRSLGSSPPQHPVSRWGPQAYTSFDNIGCQRLGFFSAYFSTRE